jgi:hypothetical protein
MWDDYTVPGGTYRENLLNTPGHPGVPDGHPAAKFRYDLLKEKYADENGDIIINRKTEQQVSSPTPVVEAEKLSVKESPAPSAVQVSA